MKKTALSCLLSAAMSVSCFADQSSPALDLYEKAQNLRNAADHIDKNSSQSDVQKAFAALTQAEQLLTSAEAIDLSYGNRYLANRLWHVYMDSMLLNAKLGNLDSAIADFEKMLEQKYFQLDFLYQYYPAEMEQLGQHPRFQSLVKKNNATLKNLTDQSLKTPYQHNIPTNQKIAGLSLFWHYAKQGFVYFDQVSELDWNQTYLDYIDQVISTKTTAEYYQKLNQFAALLQDGHTNVYYPKALRDQFYSRLPLETKLIEDKVIVTAVFSKTVAQQIAVGAEITHLNGEDIKQYANQQVAPYVSASTPQDKLVRMYNYQLFSGKKGDQVTLTVKDAHNKVAEIKLERGKKWHDLEYPKSFEFKTLANNISYIALGSFGDDQAAKMFFEHFDTIQQSDALIIDVRGNGGGSTPMAILQKLFNQPFKYSQEQLVNIDMLGLARGHYSMSWTKLGSLAQGGDANAYTKPIVVLTNAETFSAAEDFAITLKSNKRATLIGQATGGSTGQPFGFDLPGGGSARICIKRDSGPNGEAFVGVGIQPDIEVAMTVESVRQGTDLVLEQALAFLAAAR